MRGFTAFYSFCALGLIVSSINSIYVPNAVDKKTMNSLGIKTLGWQSSNQHVVIHHNYSRVHNAAGPFPTPPRFDQEETTVSDQFSETTTDRIKWQRINDRLTELAAQNFETDQNSDNNQSEFEQMAQEWQTLGSSGKSTRQQTERGALLKTINDHLSQFDQSTQDFDPQQQAEFNQTGRKINDQLSGFDQEAQRSNSDQEETTNGFDQEAQNQKWAYLGQEGVARINDQLSGFENHQKGRGYVNDQLSGFHQEIQQNQWDNLGANQEENAPFVQREVKYYDGRQFTNAHGGVDQPIRSEKLVEGGPKLYYDRPIAYKDCPEHATGQFAYHLSCNQFLNCWKGRGYVQNCAPGTLFNPKTLECDFPEKVACISGPRQTPFENRESLSSALQATCPPDFTGIIPHYADCTKFINCVNGVEFAMSCGPGTLFDVKTNLCDHAYKAECANRESTSDSRFHQGFANKYIMVKPYREGGANATYHRQYLTTGGASTNQRGQSILNINDSLDEFVRQMEVYGATNQSDDDRFASTGGTSVNPGGENQFPSQTVDASASSAFGRRPEQFGAPNQDYPNVGQGAGAYDHSYNQFGEGTSQFGSSSDQLGSGSNQFHQSGSRPNQFGGGTNQFGSSSDQLGSGSNQFHQSGSRPNQFGGGTNQFGSSSDQFGSGSNQFHQSGSRPNQFGGGTSQFGSSSDQLGSGSNQFHQSGSRPTQFGGGTNQFESSSDQLGSGSNQFHQSGSGQNQFGGGASQFGSSSDQLGSGSNQFHQSGSRPTQFGGGTNQFGSSSDQLGSGSNQFHQSGSGQNQFGGGASQFGSSSDQLGSGSNQFHQSGSRPNQFGGETNQFGSNSDQLGSDSNQFHQSGSGQNQFGGGTNQFGSGSVQYGSSSDQFQQLGGGSGQSESGLDQFGQATSTGYSQNTNLFDLEREMRNLGLDAATYCRSHPGLSEHPKNCSLFLFCETGSLMIFPCVIGSSFNPQTEACDLNYRCPKRDYVAPSSKPKCPSDYVGLLPHPTICAKFLNCNNGQTFVQDCGPGTVFNPKLSVCDYPYRVGCVDRVVPEDGQGHTGAINQNQNTRWQTTGHNLQGSSGAANQNQNRWWNQSRNQTQSHGVGNQWGTASQHHRNWWSNQNNQRQNTNLQNASWDQHSQSNLQFGADQLGASSQNNQWQITNSQNAPDQLSASSQDQNWWSNQNQNNQWQATRQNQSSRLDQNFGGSGAHVQAPPAAGQSWSTRRTYQDQNHTNPLLKHSPPPFPSTDINADYVFESDDADEVEIPERKRKNFCQIDDFRCSDDFCISQSMVCDTYKDCPDGKDEVNCEKYVEQFSVVSGTKMALREKGKYPNVTLTLCAKYCTESRGFQCKAFNYRKNDGTCFIFDTNVGLSGGLFMLPNYDYYEYRKFTVDCSAQYKCTNQKCIDFDHVCDGVNDCGDRGDEKGCKAEQLGYSVRLVGSGKPHEGVVEVSAFGRSGYICDDMFGLRDAHVLCNELGFPLGALEAHGNSYFAPQVKPNETFYMMDDVSCLGNETSLRDCDFSGWGVHNCMEQEVIGVVCKTPLEKCPKDYWRCETGNECLPLAFVCDAVNDCEDKSDEGSQYCEAAIELRLTGGKTRLEGRVEIKYHGTWGTICDDDFNDDAAKVVCKYLGHEGPAQVKKDGFFGKGGGPIWLDQIYCQGNESAIQECLHWDWGEHNCEHSEDVGVVCSDDVDEVFQIEAQRNAKLPDLDVFPERCGYRSDAIFLENDEVHFRVVKGSTARKGDYPWQASLRVKGKTRPTHWCGAVVISDRFVLTAAHCLDGFTKGAYIVVAGDYNVDVDEGTEQIAYIEDFYTHEHFRNGTRMNNDIALIKLKGAGFNFTKEVQPICLPAADFDQEKGMNCTISGFGSVQSGKAVASKELRAGWIPILDRDVCKMPHIYGDAVTDGMFCAGSLDEGVDACDGDSGGPLACLHEGFFTLIGMTSWGQHCGYANKPGVYVKIAYYRDWIDSTMLRHP